MRESRIEAHLRAEVERAGGRCQKFTSPGRRSVTDRIVMMPVARIWFVETKATGKEPSAAQAREHKRLRDMGFQVFVIDSMELVDQFIRMIRWPPR